MESQPPDHLVKVAQDVASKLKMKLPKIIVTEKVRDLGAWTRIATGKVMLSRKVVDQLDDDGLSILLLHEFKHLKYRNWTFISTAIVAMSYVILSLIIIGSSIDLGMKMCLLVFFSACAVFAVVAQFPITEREVVAYTYDMCGKFATWNLCWKLLRILGE